VYELSILAIVPWSSCGFQNCRNHLSGLGLFDVAHGAASFFPCKQQWRQGSALLHIYCLGSHCVSLETGKTRLFGITSFAELFDMGVCTDGLSIDKALLRDAK
jgi:hypothetical protein